MRYMVLYNYGAQLNSTKKTAIKMTQLQRSRDTGFTI